MALSTRAKGYLITALGVLAVSPDGLLTRFISADFVTITCWRALLFGLVAMSFVILRYRTRTFSLLAGFSWAEYCVMACYGIGNLLFIYSITHTSVANTLFMLSTTPIWAALIAWLFLKERVPRRTWVAIGAVLIGIIIITRGSHGKEGAWIGDLAGLLGAGVLALQFSIIRFARSRDTLPALAMSGILTGLVLSQFIDPMATSNNDLFFLFIMGAVMLPVASSLMFMGPRYIPAPEVSLMMLLETILGPIWVWLVVKENPGIYSIVGGTIVLLTLAINTWLGLREDRLAQKAARGLQSYDRNKTADRA